MIDFVLFPSYCSYTFIPYLSLSQNTCVKAVNFLTDQGTASMGSMLTTSETHQGGCWQRGWSPQNPFLLFDHVFVTLFYSFFPPVQSSSPLAATSGLCEQQRWEPVSHDSCWIQLTLVSIEWYTYNILIKQNVCLVLDILRNCIVLQPIWPISKSCFVSVGNGTLLKSCVSVSSLSTTSRAKCLRKSKLHSLTENSKLVLVEPL